MVADSWPTLWHPPLCIFLAQFGHIPLAPSSPFSAVTRWSVSVCYQGCKFNCLMSDSLLVLFLSFLPFFSAWETVICFISRVKSPHLTLGYYGRAFIPLCSGRITNQKNILPKNAHRTSKWLLGGQDHCVYWNKNKNFLFFMPKSNWILKSTRLSLTSNKWIILLYYGEGISHCCFVHVLFSLVHWSSFKSHLLGASYVEDAIRNLWIPHQIDIE